MKRIFNIFMLMMMMVCATATFAQKKKSSSKKKTSSSKSSSSKKKSSGSSKKSRSSKKSKSSRSSRSRSRRHYSSEEGSGRDVIVRQDMSDISWTESGEALTFQVPTAHYQSHAFLRNTTENPISFSLYEDGQWIEKSLPAKSNSDYSASQSVRFKMPGNGKNVEAVLYPGHFYNIIINPDRSADLKDATESVSVK